MAPQTGLQNLLIAIATPYTFQMQVVFCGLIGEQIKLIDDQHFRLTSLPSDRGSQRLRLIAGLLVMAFSQLLTGPNAIRAQETADIELWISQLANDDFLIRQQAEENLILSGVTGLDRLNASRQADDNEVRLRVERIIESIERGRRESLVTDFENGKGSLVGWPIYSRVNGDTPKTRKEFSAFYQEFESELKTIVGTKDPNDYLRRLLRFGRTQRNQTSDPDARRRHQACQSIAAIKLMDGLKTKQDIIETRQTLLEFALSGDASRPGNTQDSFFRLHRAAIAAWMDLDDDTSMMVSQKLSVIQRLSIPNGTSVAVRCLENPEKYPVNILRSAFMVLAKFGNDSHTELLTGLLNNDRQVTVASFGNRSQDSDNKTSRQFVVQVGDLSLATLVRIANQDYVDFGFTPQRILRSGEYLPISYSGFASQMERDESRKKWKQYLKTRGNASKANREKPESDN